MMYKTGRRPILLSLSVSLELARPLSLPPSLLWTMDALESLHTVPRHVERKDSYDEKSDPDEKGSVSVHSAPEDVWDDKTPDGKERPIGTLSDASMLSGSSC